VDGGARNGGFDGKPWLPVPGKHLQAVNVQQGDDSSLPEHYRRFLAFRRSHTALAKGDIDFIGSEGDTVAFTRRAGNGRSSASSICQTRRSRSRRPIAAAFADTAGVTPAPSALAATAPGRAYRLNL
jgi:glycosidase